MFPSSGNTVSVSSVEMTDKSRAKYHWKILSQAVSNGSKNVSRSSDLIIARNSDVWNIFIPNFFASTTLKCFSQEFDHSSWINLNVVNHAHGNLSPEFATLLDSLQLSICNKPIELHSGRTQGLLSILSGFDNTGNVDLWPSEVLLAHSMFVPELYPKMIGVLRDFYSDASARRVCELGAGMTGAAGLAISLQFRQTEAALLAPSFVLLTDGNQQSVASLSEQISRHEDRLSEIASNGLTAHPKIEASRVIWADEYMQPDVGAETTTVDRFKESFDLVMAADCFFRQTGHKGLLELIDSLLSRRLGAIFIAVAPERGGTLSKFIQLVQSTGGWSVEHFSPQDFICPSFYASLIDRLSGKWGDSVFDKVLASLLILRRI